MPTGFSFTLPRGFGPIPLDPDARDREQRARRLLEHLPADALGDRAQAIEGLVMAGEALRAVGAVVAGELTLEDEEPSISATVVLAVRELPDGGTDLKSPDARRVAAAALAEVLREHHPDADVRATDFAGGPAVVLTQVGEFQLPGSRTTTGTAVTAPSNRLQVLFPAPEGDTMVVLDMNTYHTQHWARFTELAMAMADGVHFEDREVDLRP